MGKLGCEFFRGCNFEIGIKLTCCGPEMTLCQLRSLDANEVSLWFKDSGHAGDKRKRNQPCCLKSTSLLRKYILIC